MAANNFVTVVKHPESGEVITKSSKNPEYGTIRVDALTVSMEKGFLNKSNRSAFIRGKVSDLESLGLKDGSKISGKIIKRESFKPFYPGQSPKINPTTGEILLKDEKETYIEFVYTEDLSSCDTWVGETTFVADAQVAEAIQAQAAV